MWTPQALPSPGQRPTHTHNRHSGELPPPCCPPATHCYPVSVACLFVFCSCKHPRGEQSTCLAALTPLLRCLARRRRPDGKWRRQKAGSKAFAYGGWSAFALGNMLRFIAMRFAAQTVLSGLGSLQFVIIPVASRFMLGIRASASTLLGVFVVLVGALRGGMCMLVGPVQHAAM